MTGFHLAQINTARMRAPLEDPSMAGFAAGLARMNDLAEHSPGFVWRLAAAGPAPDAFTFRQTFSPPAARPAPLPARPA